MSIKLPVVFLYHSFTSCRNCMTSVSLLTSDLRLFFFFLQVPKVLIIDLRHFFFSHINTMLQIFLSAHTQLHPINFGVFYFHFHSVLCISFKSFSLIHGSFRCYNIFIFRNFPSTLLEGTFYLFKEINHVSLLISSLIPLCPQNLLCMISILSSLY